MKVSNRGLVQITLFVALMVIGGMLTLSFGSPVPYSLQTFFCLLAGLVLGKKYGAFSQVIYLLLGLVGLPVFAGFQGGLASLVKPTFGFLLGFVLAAFITGLLYEKLPMKNKSMRGVISAVAGTCSIYLIGVPYAYFLFNMVLEKSIDFTGILGITVLPFLIPDILKAVLAGLIGILIRSILSKRQLLEKEK